MINNFNSFNKGRDIMSIILEKVETIMKTKKKAEIFKTKDWVSEDELSIEVMGQGVERSYEDRSVYLKIKIGDIEKELWINGEESIKLGQILISHGLFSLESNMVNHQKIHHYNNLKQFLDEDRVDKVILKKISDKPKGFGYGFNIFNITLSYKSSM